MPADVGTFVAGIVGAVVLWYLFPPVPPPGAECGDDDVTGEDEDHGESDLEGEENEQPHRGLRMW